jgi:hypothetical protein
MYQRNASAKSCGRAGGADEGVCSDPSLIRCILMISSRHAARGRTFAGGTRWHVPQAAGAEVADRSGRAPCSNLSTLAVPPASITVSAPAATTNVDPDPAMRRLL